MGLYRQQLQRGFYRQLLPNASLLFMISCLPATTSDRNVALYKSEAEHEEGVRCQHCGIAIAENIRSFFIVYSFPALIQLLSIPLSGRETTAEQRTRNVGSLRDYEYKPRGRGRIAAKSNTQLGNSVLICLPLLIDFIGRGCERCWLVNFASMYEPSSLCLIKKLHNGAVMGFRFPICGQPQIILCLNRRRQRIYGSGRTRCAAT